MWMFGWEVLEVCNDWRVNASCVPVPSHLLVSWLNCSHTNDFMAIFN